MGLIIYYDSTITQLELKLSLGHSDSFSCVLSLQAILFAGGSLSVFLSLSMLLLVLSVWYCTNISLSLSVSCVFWSLSRSQAKDSDLALLANIPLALLDSSLCWWISFWCTCWKLILSWGSSVPHLPPIRDPALGMHR